MHVRFDDENQTLFIKKNKNQNQLGFPIKSRSDF
jgi:hypothetical protein